MKKVVVLKRKKQKRKRLPFPILWILIGFMLYAYPIVFFDHVKNTDLSARDNDQNGSQTKITYIENEEDVEAEKELSEIVEDQLNNLDLDALQNYVDSLEGFDVGNVAERLLNYIKGEKFDYVGFGQKILKVLLEKVVQISPLFACIAAITLLSGIVSTLQSGKLGNSSANMVFLISYAAALIPLLGIITECIKQTFSCISNMQRQMHVMYPLMLTLMAASGGTLSAAICRPAVAFFSNGIVSIFTSVVFPLTIAIIAFSMADNLTNDLKISKVSINGLSVFVFQCSDYFLPCKALRLQRTTALCVG